MMRTPTPREIPLILVATVLGAVGGVSLALARQAAWHPLGRPPETPQSVLASAPDAVIVRGVSGQSYGFEDRAYSFRQGGVPQGEWSTQLPDVQQWGLDDCRHEVLAQAGRLPRAVKDVLTCWSLIERSRMGFSYALLADGSVWRWSTPKDLDVWIMPLCPGLVGALMGLIVGVALLRAFPMVGKRTLPAH